MHSKMLVLECMLLNTALGRFGVWSLSLEDSRGSKAEGVSVSVSL
ncbi:hypothetical protein [Bartonella sp. AR 15-3]|nr:hypothetical protein [Bartonella sp. AR 15-3]OPB32216.1 hypothetical protein BAR153v2_011990 [Bartonella sp. AR 15-3]CBI79871.1 hypothetical protein BAR15_180104 [Bartonella sp. AR 15-3]